MKNKVNENKKNWWPHFFIRFGTFPVLIGLIYLLTKNFKSESFVNAGPLKMSFFAAAAILALILMSETILLFGKKKTTKFIVNIITLFLVIFCVILISPHL